MVPGVRVHGDKASDVEVTLDDFFSEVPVAEKIGIPLRLKKMSGTGGDDSAIRKSSICRMMSDPDDGFAPMEWQYGGPRGPAPPVVLVRKDKVPFSTDDWACLESYVGDWLDECGEAEEERGEVNKRLLTLDAFKQFVESRLTQWPSAFLSLRFPVGSIVVASGLSIEELNDKEGEVVRYGRDRVGVRFVELPERDVTALKPERLRVVRQPVVMPSEPSTKRHDTGEEKAARQVELAKQDALAVAKRLFDCMLQDEFPERGDLHLFGLGGNYQARATEVMAVWQGLVKNGDITEANLAEALYAGRIKEFFQEKCYKFADSRSPNSTYAKALIASKFAALEWDDL